MATCPDCEFDEIDLEDYEDGDTLSCPECGRTLTVNGDDLDFVDDEDDLDDDEDDEDEDGEEEDGDDLDDEEVDDDEDEDFDE